MGLPVKRFWQLSLLVLFAVGVAVVLLNFTYRDLQTDFARKETLQQAYWLQNQLDLFLSDDSAMAAQQKIIEIIERKKPNDLFGEFSQVLLYQTSTGKVRYGKAVKLPAAPDSLIKLQSYNPSKPDLIALPKKAQWVLLVPVGAGNAEPAYVLILIKNIPKIGWFTVDFWRWFAPLIVVISLIVLLILVVVYHSFRQPLRSVRNLADHLQAGDYQYRIKYSGKDEFTDTFVRINRSLERLGASNVSYHQKEARIRNLLEALDESIVVLDDNLKITSFNPAVVRLLHCPSEETFESCFRQILEENRALRDLIQQFKTLNQKSLSRDMVVWAADEQELNIGLTLQRLDAGHFLLTFKDLSRIKELQSNLLRSMKFGIIANLVSSISHEIRNPLSAVGIHTEILSTRLHKEYPELDPKLKKSLDIIQNEIKRIHRIHTQFFNLARKRELKLSALKPNAIIDDVIQLVQHHALEQQIRLQTELDANIDFIYGDADQLKQVILNVVLNAFQAVGEDGRVLIKTSQDGRKVYIEVTDNGPGIPPETGEHIFDLYFTTKADGGGIGLALCKKIVEAHEGRIWFRSTPGQGATFTIALPRISQTRKQRIQTRLTHLNG